MFHRAGTFEFAFDRRVAVERKMRLHVQLVVEVRSEDTHEMPLIRDDDVVETLATDRIDQAFAIRILPGSARCDDDFLDAHIGDVFTEALAVDSVAITN